MEQKKTKKNIVHYKPKDTYNRNRNEYKKVGKKQRNKIYILQPHI